MAAAKRDHLIINIINFKEQVELRVQIQREICTWYLFLKSWFYHVSRIDSLYFLLLFFYKSEVRSLPNSYNLILEAYGSSLTDLEPGKPP